MPTYLCWRDDDRQYVLEHLDELVVKAANESGGYGMLVGPHATAGAAGRIRGKIERPSAQLHRPAHAGPLPGAHDCRRRFEGRHVDLRPYILYGKDITCCPAA